MAASEYVGLTDTVRFGMITRHPASGTLQAADSTPRCYIFRNDSDTPVFESGMILRSNTLSTYRGAFPMNWPGTNIVAGDYIEIQGSGTVQGQTDRIIMKSFVVGDVFDANMVKETGVNIDYVYYADIELVQDSAGSEDEYGVQWFRNAIPLASGQVTNAAFSVYNGITGAALLSNRALSYTSSFVGVLTRTESTLTASGVPYLIVTSGTIDSGTRNWQNIVGKI